MDFYVLNCRSVIAGISVIAGVAAMAACVHPADPCTGDREQLQWDEETPQGTTPGDIIAPHEGENEVVASSPQHGGSQSITVSLVRGEEQPIYYTEEVPEHENCSDQLTIPVDVEISTANGTLDETFSDEFQNYIGDDVEEGLVLEQWIPAEDIEGTWSPEVATQSNFLALSIKLIIDDGNLSGEIQEWRTTDNYRDHDVIWSW